MIKVKELEIPTFNDYEAAEFLISKCAKKLTLDDLGFQSKNITLHEALREEPQLAKC